MLSLPAWSVPMMINVQGKLTDRTTGSPITSSIWSTFKLYAVPTGGTATWTSPNYLLQPDSNGIFNVNIGATNLPEFLTDDYYLEILVGPETEPPLSPRQRLVSVPFAIMAKNLKGGLVEAIGDPAVKGSVAGATTTFGELGRKITGIFFTKVNFTNYR